MKIILLSLSMLLIAGLSCLGEGKSIDIENWRLSSYKLEDGLMCYQSAKNQSIPEVACPSFRNTCATCQFTEAGAGPTETIRVYFCADEDICSDPEAYCAELQKQLPFKIGKCTLKCCSQDGCNKPVKR